MQLKVLRLQRRNVITAVNSSNLMQRCADSVNRLLQNEIGRTSIGGVMEKEKYVDITVADVAGAIGATEVGMMRSLALVGWNVLMNDATRLAHADYFASLQGTPIRQRKQFPGVGWKHVLESARELIPDAKTTAPKRPLGTRKQGYIYVLFDSATGFCKIGRTSSAGQRQRVQMSAHGALLSNVINAEVEDCHLEEIKCHKHFEEFRKNGEWFDVRPDAIVDYIINYIKPKSFDCENLEALRGFGLL
jgi:hypothetical protein